MYFLIQSIKKGYTVIFESVHLGKSWVFSKSGSRVIEKPRIAIQDVPEIKSKQTVHIFDAKAGPNTYDITRVVAGARQIVFSSTNRASYAQFIREPTVFQALLPSTTKEEFDKYVALFDVPKLTVDKVIEVSGYGRIRPLANVQNHIKRIHTAIESENFDPRRLGLYTSAESNISGTSNPAILLDAKVGQDLSEKDQQDLHKLFHMYDFGESTWYFSSDYIVEQIFTRLGTEADVMVESLYYSLGSNFNRTYPAVGRLFEWCAVKAGFISRHGLVCEPLDNNYTGPNTLMIGKGLKVQDYESKQHISVKEVIEKCTDPNIIYNFGKNHAYFDCFIPPNNFIGFTQKLVAGETKGNHPINLSFALNCCELLNKGSGGINFITAVPAHQVNIWNTPQSFKIDSTAIATINRLGKEDYKLIKEGSQSTLDKLPPAVQHKLKPFRQFVGKLVSKRNFSTSVCQHIPTRLLSSIRFAYKYIK
jgi:hypothetical protein